MMGCDVWLRKPDPTGRKSEAQLFDETVAAITARYTAQGEKVYYIPIRRFQ